MGGAGNVGLIGIVRERQARAVVARERFLDPPLEQRLVLAILKPGSTILRRRDGASGVHIEQLVSHKADVAGALALVPDGRKRDRLLPATKRDVRPYPIALGVLVDVRF